MKEARSKAGETTINPKDGAEMVYVPAGEFLMGSSDEQVADEMKRLEHFPKHVRDCLKWNFETEWPQRKIHLDGYWIYKHSVTVAQYRKFCEDTDRGMPEASDWDWKDDHPMVMVNWQDAEEYAEWAGVLLPTEAQWEKAARGTDGRVYPWGNEWDASKCANSAEKNLEGTQPVGSYPAGMSYYGVMDMAENVWDWCADWFDPDYYKSGPTRNPTGPLAAVEFLIPDSGMFSGTRVLRGGSWFVENYGLCRCTFRDFNFPTGRSLITGFRCAMTP